MPEPNTREEQFYDAIATGDASGLPDPVTRKEKFLAAIAAGETSGLPTPITREEQYLEYIAEHGGGGGGGGGGDITVEPLSVTENGTYTADEGKAYSPVNVSVPNSYAAADEGKVVSNGALVSQTAHAEVTQNGTVDTTHNNSVTVNVSGGALTLHTGTITPATDTTDMVITGLGAPAMIVKFGVTENAADGTAKITAGVFAAGSIAMSRTNSNGVSPDSGAYAIAPNNVFNSRTVYDDGSAPAAGNCIYATKTGFVVRTPSYKFKAGYTYAWQCYTYPES